MIVPVASLLIVTAAFPVLGGIAVLGASLRGQRKASLLLTRLGLIGGAVCGAILAVLLAREPESVSPTVQLSLWTWLSCSLPLSPSITFGLEATSIKACLVSLTGGLALIALWNAGSSTKSSLSDEAILTTSLLYAAGTIFAFAPNTAQALLGWAGISLLAVILIRLSHQQRPPQSRYNETTLARGTTTSGGELMTDRLMHRLRSLESTAGYLESLYLERVWRAFTGRWPDWAAEQTEVLEDRSVSIRLLAMTLGASVIWLTWLIGI